MSEQEIYRKWQQNPMLKPRIQKVTVNVSVGKSGEPLENAMKIIEELTGQKPCTRRAKRTIRDFGIRKGEPTACLVTVRKERAESFLRKAFQAIGNNVSKESFDRLGNLAFGIKEHIEIPGTKYVPELGIIGMDVIIALERPGYRVKRRRRIKSKIGRSHLLTVEESMLLLKDKFGVGIE
ncbi:MAG: 50S ribosomal protein L5 [Candidatus Bathyarchaeota archaeon]|nr:50S ribosomal protein L5 [Candidatus Bathyarchaeota archaeon]